MATSWVSEKQGCVRGQEGLLYGRILLEEENEVEEEEEEKEEEGFSVRRTATEVNVQERALDSKE